MSAPPHVLTGQTASLVSHLSIFTKGLLLIAIPVMFQLALLWVVHDVQTAARDAQSWANHSQDVIARADEISRLVVQLVAVQRGAVLTGNPDFDAASRPPPGELNRQLDELRALVTDNPAQAERVEQLRQAAIALEGWVMQEQALLQHNRVADAAERVRSGIAATRVRHVREAVAAFLAAEHRIGDEREARLHTANALEQRVTVAGAIVSLLLAGALVYGFTRSIASRLAIVSENAGRVAAGVPLVSPVAGTDEIAQLDRVLHQAAQRLADNAEAEQQARLEIERRNTELAQLNLELAQKTQENELFIYSVSHDLRSPLVNLQGFSKELTRSCHELEEVLRDDRIAADLRTRAAVLIERDIPESVHFIRTAVSRASLIIDALLRLSRAGRVEYRWQRVPVQAIVSNVLDAMRATINEHKAVVLVRPLADAWGDPTAVEQIFANLIGNAVNYLDASRPGRIEIGMAETEPERGTEMEPAAESRIRATRTYFVTDNGVGMAAGALPKVFVAFQRLHTRGVAPGEGIGLALVRRIVDRHQGQIWVESTEGVGSTFFVTLPAEPPASDHTASSDQTASAAAPASTASATARETAAGTATAPATQAAHVS